MIFFFADLGNSVGSEQSGIRPVLIVQNDVGNKYSRTIIAASITSKLTKSDLPTHITLTWRNSGLSEESIVLCEQIRTIDKTRLLNKVGRVSKQAMQKINKALMIACGVETMYIY